MTNFIRRWQLAAAFIFLFVGLPVHGTGNLDYPDAVKPIIEQRCMVCHGCYDAPCQLKLEAYIGLQRGANKTKVYDATRLLNGNLTRLFEDALTSEEWRKKDFYSVLDPQQPTQGTLYKLLQLKQQHPLPAGERLPDSFDFGLDRDQQCAKSNQFEAYERDHPLWGMPYGFPGLQPAEHEQLVKWLEQGSPGVAVPVAPADELAAVANWEAFFNGTSLKQQLMARYIYEHLFIADLYFPALPRRPVWYTLVRSTTPPGEPIAIIATRRPYDSPGKQPFYYRLQARPTAILDKRHMPYALDSARQQRWTELFLDADYSVMSLPDYSLEVAANPFISFQDLPVATRYRFMLEEAQFTIMAFIKGPVCRGQVALNVIEDNFWVAFLEPSVLNPKETAEYLKRESKAMRLPDGEDGLLMSVATWKGYAARQQEMLRGRAEFLHQQVGEHDLAVNLDAIWDGDGHNDNAALTIFRHNDSASVVKGFVGETPKSAWVINYSLLERIHYLLVAGFDVYGMAGHQLQSRMYMDFLRMEGEQNFLTFLPEYQRKALRNFWYRDALDHVKNYVGSPENSQYKIKTDIAYTSNDPRTEFLAMLRSRLPGAGASRYQVTNVLLQQLQLQRGRPFSYLPEVAFLRLLRKNGELDSYTVLRNSAYTNNAQLFEESKRRIPEEDTLTVANGFIGSYPNIFFQVHEQELGAFTSAIYQLDSEAAYSAFVQRWGVPRNTPWFWKLSDSFFEAYRQDQPLESGLFDLNRYENR